MHSFVAAASLLALASTAIAGNAIVQNNCQEQVFLTITLSDQSSTQQALAGSGGMYSEPISGQGKSFGITKSSDYYSDSTPKLIWGFSDSAPTLYYSVSSVNGDPMSGESWDLSPSDSSCPSVSDYSGNTETCADSNDFTLTLC
ncbi:hypothetical protein MBLNU459_g3176t1 [Dothideomycetes sp. NU459]